MSFNPAERTILDLYSGSGNWSRPYVDAGYDVVRVEIETGHDVRLLHNTNGVQVHGILAGPPCTVFANSGARWPRSKEDYLDALSMVDAVFRYVAVCQPVWWVLENPVGKLRRWLGPPAMYFDPCDYGDPYTKRTALWGEFTTPEPNPVEPVLGSFMHTSCGGGRSKLTKRKRSATPPGFAKSFFEANP